MFILDNNFILDIVTKRSTCGETRAKVLAHIIQSNKCAISSSSLHNLEYVIKKNYPRSFAAYRKLVALAQIIKTPSYVDFDCNLATQDIEDYLIELSAQSVGGMIITADKEFLRRSELTIHPDDYFNFIRRQSQNIPFCDLNAQQQKIAPTLEKNIDNVLRHGQYILGPEVAELEERLKTFVGVKHCITCASGTDALQIAQMALDIGPGDEVIIPGFTYIATAETVALLGAKLVYVDIDPRTYNLDPTKLEAAITPRTRAVIPVSLYGQCADFDAINAIVDAYNHQPSTINRL